MKSRMLLSAPVRLYWELVPESAGGISHGTALDVAAEVAAMKVFFVTARLSGGKRHDLGALVTEMKKGGVSLKFSAADRKSLPDGDVSSQTGGLEIFVDSPDGGLAERLNEIHSACLKAGLTPTSVAAVPSKANAESFEGFFERCLELGLTSISLPNPVVVGNLAGTGPYVLDSLSRASIKKAAEKVLAGREGSVKLFVHELFLYRELNMPGIGERTEYAGCQAAEAIAYIGPDGTVYPCSSWPEPIGNLEENTFREIWSGAERKDVVTRIGDLPEECRGCGIKDECFGGCRGLAVAMEAEEKPDPGCPIIKGQ